MHLTLSEYISLFLNASHSPLNASHSKLEAKSQPGLGSGSGYLHCVGDAIDLRFYGDSKWYSGVIAAASTCFEHGADLFDVRLDDDGTVELQVVCAVLCCAVLCCTVLCCA